TLDQLPDLPLILGHWGEVVMFYLDRIDIMTAPPACGARYRTTSPQTCTSRRAASSASATCNGQWKSLAPSGCCSPPTTHSGFSPTARPDNSSTPPRWARTSVASSPRPIGNASAPASAVNRPHEPNPP